MVTSESVIRRMTRLSVEHDAVNLAQGFTDESPPYAMVWAAVSALLGGTVAGMRRLDDVTLADLMTGPEGARTSLEQALKSLHGTHDTLSQYSFPFGLSGLREAVADYTSRRYGFRPDPDHEVTVVLGATEGMASVLRALASPGDGVIVVQPFHEMYPAQAEVFGLRPVYVSLRDEDGDWRLEPDELRAAAAQGARVLVLNTPHNPTGKVFTREELGEIARVAVEHDLVVVADEIYEQITYDGHHHVGLASLPGMRQRTVTVNAVSKMGKATGWRVGWVVADRSRMTGIRAVHDTLVIQAPTPLQQASIRLLGMTEGYFEELRGAYRQKREVLMSALRRVGFRVRPPQGAYYLFADYRGVPPLADFSPMGAALFLVEQIGVAAVPGDNFFATEGADDRYLRFAFCRGLDALRTAAERLDRLAEGGVGRQGRGS